MEDYHRYTFECSEIELKFCMLGVQTWEHIAGFKHFLKVKNILKTQKAVEAIQNNLC